MKLDYIIAKAERGYTKGEKAAIGGGLTAAAGGVLGEAVNVDSHNRLANSLRSNYVASGVKPSVADMKQVKRLKRNIHVSRGVWGGGSLVALGGVARRANRQIKADAQS